jgi:hypothetical protein
MKASDVKKGMVVYDGTGYHKVLEIKDGEVVLNVDDWPFHTQPKYLRPLTKRERGGAK